MLIDLARYDGPAEQNCDVCVIGAGAAGLTLAQRLRAAGQSVCVLEAGGGDYEESTQALYDGTNIGDTYYPLRDSRLRFFGGTTNIWGGRCVPLDPLDLEQREWVEHSGWPISIDDLAPHYLSAHNALNLGDYEYDARLWSRVSAAAPGFDPAHFATRVWRFDTVRDRFAAPAPPAYRSDERFTLVLHANVTHLQADADARGLRYVQAQSLTGRELRVVARSYVLACGAIENARLMLASRDVQSNGIGNDHDQVGRYFMEHPHARIATLSGPAAYTVWSAYRKRYQGVPVAPALVPSAQLQRRLGILNSAITFKLQRPQHLGEPLNRRLYMSLKHQLPPNRQGRALWHTYRAAKATLQRLLAGPVERARVGLGWVGLHAMVRAEQAPNPASRVRLDTATDALGVPQALLDWRLGELDKRTQLVLAQTLAAEFERLQLGQLTPSAWLTEAGTAWPVDGTLGNHPIGGYHHMGTTRMSETAATGVVDANCRVHGYRDLYVAGSSVFTTGGWANPTLTLLALSHRLGEHLVAQHDRLRG